jgi:hypothetical protein
MESFSLEQRVAQKDTKEGPAWLQCRRRCLIQLGLWDVVFEPEVLGKKILEKK